VYRPGRAGFPSAGRRLTPRSERDGPASPHEYDPLSLGDAGAPDPQGRCAGGPDLRRHPPAGAL